MSGGGDLIGVGLVSGRSATCISQEIALINLLTRRDCEAHFKFLLTSKVPIILFLSTIFGSFVLYIGVGLVNYKAAENGDRTEGVEGAGGTTVEMGGEAGAGLRESRILVLEKIQ